MAYFHCLIGGGSSGGGYELTVTCDADFAGTTITCTDGVSTLTATCPSASPYEVVFEIPNGGNWTISGVVSGQTVTTGVNIPTTATLEAIIQKTITIYSAKEDTVTYTDIYGDTQTEVFASGQTSKQISVDIEASGSSITFTSGVAKNPSDLTAYYSKTVTITSNTTDVYLMPENALYWWGYESSNFENAVTANGWSSSFTLVNATHNTNEISLSSANNQICAVGNKTAVSGSSMIYIHQGVTAQGGNYGGFEKSSSKSLTFSNPTLAISSSMTKYTVSIDSYQVAYTGSNRSAKLYAMWYE